MMIVQINDDSTITIEDARGRIPCRISGKYVEAYELSLGTATNEQCANFGCRWDLIKDSVAADNARQRLETIRSSNAYKNAVLTAREMSYNEHDRREATSKAVHVDVLINRLLELKNRDQHAHVLISNFDQDEQFGKFTAEFEKMFSHDGSNFYELNVE